VANVDLRGCGDSSLGWPGYRRTDIADDLIALVRHLGGPAVLIGQSISGGAATIAAAKAPDLVAGVIELAPGTRKQSFDLPGLLRVRHYRAAYLQLGQIIMRGRLANWTKYLNLAYPRKPTDWTTELARIETTLSAPGRMAVVQAMFKASPADAHAQLPHVRCPVLVIEGSLDPDWPDPRAEGEKIVAALPPGLGELHVIEGAGHYLQAQTPGEVLALALPFLTRTLPSA
jgi:pimeloyl-ACP methyl ester carboxylesterase